MAARLALVDRSAHAAHSYDEYRWTFVGSNNEALAVSKAYASKDECKRSIDVVKAEPHGASVEDLAVVRPRP